MRGAILALPLLAISVPATAQSMDHSSMPGMQMPGMKMEPKPAAKPKAKPRAKATAKAATKKRGTPARARAAAPRQSRPAQAGMSGMNMGATPAADPHAGHNMADMPGMNMGSSGGQAAPAQPMQGHDMSAMPGMNMGQQPAADPHAGHNMSAMPGMSQNGEQSAQPMQGHDMSAMPGMDQGQMQGMDHGGMAGMKMGPSGTVKPVTGTASPPAPPSDHAADPIWGANVMQGARADLRAETGGQTFYMVLFNLAEYQARNGRDGYRWDGEAWYGGDINRLTLKTEGEGALREGVESAEVQALYSRSIGPYWFLQGGLRYDFKPNPSRTYATIGIEGLAPNNFDVEGAAFLSDKGDVLARIEGYYDQRLTQRLILQPRIESNLAAQDMRANGIGSGLSNIEAGLRLRYEIAREFAPYVGVSWDRKLGDTARFARATGDRAGTPAFVAGIRTWF